MQKQHLFGHFYIRILIHFRPHCRVGTVSYACQDNRVLQINEGSTGKKKVVILGTGWAGASFLRNIDTSLYDVHVVSPRNYFMFTPLLPSVTCGTVEPRSIVEPIRNIVRKVPFCISNSYFYYAAFLFIPCR
jgi:hypothetical protein